MQLKYQNNLKNSNVVLLDKPLGLTPAQAIIGLKTKFPRYAEHNFTYAGRLDPAAQGLILLISGDEIANKKLYLNLPKTYQAEIVFGISTDSQDVFGLSKIFRKPIPSLKKIKLCAQNFVGQVNLRPPIYSSQILDRKPLFAHAQANAIKASDVMAKPMKFNKIKFISSRQISKREILRKVDFLCAEISGQFRNQQIRSVWHKQLSTAKQEKFLTLKFLIECESGAYIRSLAAEIGKHANYASTLFSLTRTKIGEYKLADAFNLK